MNETLLSESRLSLCDLAREQSVHISTCWRWCLRGIRGHKLESYSLGGRKYTTREAFSRFVARTNDEEVVAGVTPKQRERAAEQAERELHRAGW